MTATRKSKENEVFAESALLDRQRFLQLSSTGLLAGLAALFGLPFYAALHLSTLVAVVWFFWRDLTRLALALAGVVVILLASGGVASRIRQGRKVAQAPCWLFGRASFHLSH